MADGVVLVAVPDNGLTYLTRLGPCAKASEPIVNNNIKKHTRAFSILKIMAVRIDFN